jgi:hypothetical protein
LCPDIRAIGSIGIAWGDRSTDRLASLQVSRVTPFGLRPQFAQLSGHRPVPAAFFASSRVELVDAPRIPGEPMGALGTERRHVRRDREVVAPTLIAAARFPEVRVVHHSRLPCRAMKLTGRPRPSRAHELPRGSGTNDVAGSGAARGSAGNPILSRVYRPRSSRH